MAMLFHTILRWPLFLRAIAYTNARRSSSLWKSHLCFDYPDMAIHASRHAIFSLIDGILQRASIPTLVNSNVNIRLCLDHVNLGHDARRVLRSPTVGGSSVLSEALSVELLTRLLPLRLVKTEAELGRPHIGQPMTDYTCRLPLLGVGLIGVSVTRAVAFQRQYTMNDASQLITRKLRAIHLSNHQYRFEKHILHIWAESGTNASLVRRVCRNLAHDLKGNTVILISTVNAESVFFKNNSLLSMKP